MAAPGTRHMIFFWEFINSLQAGTVASAEADATTYFNTVKARYPTAELYAVNLVPFGSAATGNWTDANRVTINNWLAANYVSLGLTGVLDFASMTEFSNPADALNFNDDKLHIATHGNKILAKKIADTYFPGAWVELATSLAGLYLASDVTAGLASSPWPMVLSDHSATLSRTSNVANAPATWNTTRSIVARSSGKYYFEIKIAAVQNANLALIGLANAAATQATYPGGSGISCGLLNNGRFLSGMTAGVAFTPPTPGAGDTLGLAVDFAAGKVWLAQNGTWRDAGDPVAGTNALVTFTAGTSLYAAMGHWHFFSGGLKFQLDSAKQTYAAPTGYTAWGTS